MKEKLNQFKNWVITNWINISIFTLFVLVISFASWLVRGLILGMFILGIVDSVMKKNKK